MELKCGCGKEALAACTWDAVKLAFLLAKQDFVTCFLLAGAGSSDWDAGVEGAEFFGDYEWMSEEVRLVHTSWFSHWEKQGYRPLRVPTAFRTRYLGAFAFLVADAPWELRLARVEVTADASWFEWESLLLAGGTV